MSWRYAKLALPRLYGVSVPNHLESLFTALADRRCFVAWYPAPKNDGSGKSDKIPYHPLTRANIDAQDPAQWFSADDASHYAAHGVHIGIVLSEALGVFCIDLDAALQTDEQWSAFAVSIARQFPGACMEVSHSGRGLHIFGSHQPIPDHRTRVAGTPLEVYTRKRFIALTGTNIQGDVRTDHTAALSHLIATHLPEPVASHHGEWTTLPVDPRSDAQIIQSLLDRTGNARATFGDGASFADLWTANTEALTRAFPDATGKSAYDASAADMALSNHLAWACSYNAERTLQLMQGSALRRDKWERTDYLRRTIMRAVAGKLAPAPVPAGTDVYASLIDRTDQGNANLLIQQANGTLRFVAETKQWLYWTGARWQVDTHEVFVNTRALKVAQHYLAEAQRLELERRIGEADGTFKWAAKCRNAQSLNNMITQARKSEGVPISLKELDRDPWLLGVENGVVDLRTGALRPDARDEYVTKRCAVAYDRAATAPRWEQFIAEITGTPTNASHRFTPRPTLASYLQRALGYSVTGSTREHKIFLAIGAGSNGKNVVFEAVKRVLGDYACVMKAEALMASDRSLDAERPTATAAGLAGARFVLSSETKDQQTLDVGSLKNHTGDEEMSARRMRENPFTFRITHKVWLMTNNRPALDHVDAAVRGRLHLVPFDRRWNRPGEYEPDPTLPNGDKELSANLEREADGILAWLVRGAVLYQRDQLGAPAEVVALTRDYMLEQDDLGRWIATMKRCPPDDGQLASWLYAAFMNWCAVDGVMPKQKNQNAFGRALKAKGVERSDNRAAGTRYGLRS